MSNWGEYLLSQDGSNLVKKEIIIGRSCRLQEGYRQTRTA